MTEKKAISRDHARQTVIGIVTGRINNDSKASALMIELYIREAVEEGYTPADAWAQLFAASSLLIIPLLQCQAGHHGVSMNQNLADMGHYYAALETFGHGQ